MVYLFRLFEKNLCLKIYIKPGSISIPDLTFDKGQASLLEYSVFNRVYDIENSGEKEDSVLRLSLY